MNHMICSLELKHVCNLAKVGVIAETADFVIVTLKFYPSRRPGRERYERDSYNGHVDVTVT